MSVLEDIRSNAEGAHGSLDEAQTLVKQAFDEANDLEQSAAAHGWAALAQAIDTTEWPMEWGRRQ